MAGEKPSERQEIAYSSTSCFFPFLADEAVRTLIRLVQPQLQETVATTELGNVMAGPGTLLAWGRFPMADRLTDILIGYIPSQPDSRPDGQSSPISQCGRLEARTECIT
jgi:hypothetical protein